MRNPGLYLHIPFCARKCAYCDFPSFAGEEARFAPYARAVEAEIEQRKSESARFSTVYIGGGTPSLFPNDLMKSVLGALFTYFPMEKGAEFTCECNPGTLTEGFLQTLLPFGLNRLSMGAQACQPALLKTLGRIHEWQDVEAAFALARAAGIRNINLDLMFGLPGQSVKDFAETLDAALALCPTHISCYGLILEDGTPLKRDVDAGKLSLPDDSQERDMYELARERLRRAGFFHYEISNFARPGFECAHNVNCWRRLPYLGFGASACGFINDARRTNPPLFSYLNGGAPAIENISPADARFESVMLGLRLMSGVSDADFSAMHGLSLRAAFGDKLDEPIREGLLEWKNDSLRLTRKGMDFQNRALVMLMD